MPQATVWRERAPWLLTAAILAAVYGPHLGAPLVWDDRGAIFFNDTIGRWPSLRAFFGPEYFDLSRELTWRPAATAVYELSARAFGLTPLGFRLPNFLLHLANGALLFALLGRLGLPAQARRWAAALFLIHPVHVETLMCAAFNEEILAAAGLMALLLAHDRGATGAAAAVLAAALLSKESALAAAALVPAYDAARRRAPRAGAYAAYGAVMAAYAWWRFVALPGPDPRLAEPLPIAERLLYAGQGLAEAARLLLVPLGLSIEYFAVPPDSAAAGLAWTAAGSALAAGAAVAVGRLARADRGLAFLAFWPLPFLALTSGLLPAGALTLRYMAERWLYLPFLGAVPLLARALSGRRALAAAAALAWGGLGVARVQDWAREDRLWESLTRAYPWSAKAWEGLGEARYRGEDPAGALAAFTQALALREQRRDKVLARYAVPGSPLRWESPSLLRWLGTTHRDLGRRAEAAAFLERSLALDPAHPHPYRLLAALAAERGDFARARSWAGRGLERFPQDAALRFLKTVKKP